MEHIKNYISAITVIANIVLLIVLVRAPLRRTKRTKEKLTKHMKLLRILIPIVFLLYVCTFVLDMMVSGITVSQRWGQVLVLWVYVCPAVILYFLEKNLLNQLSEGEPTAKVSSEERDGGTALPLENTEKE